MAMVIPNNGKLLWLYWALIGGGGAADMTCHLFSNDYTPDDDTVTGDMTESTFPGYASVPMLRSDFDTPVLVGDIAQSDSLEPPVYLCTGGGGELAYGWYLTDDTSNTCLAAERFAAPRNMVDGASLALDPFRFKLREF